MRKFEVVTSFEDKGINLPKRGTAFSAGYDFEAAETVTIPSIFRQFEKFKAGDKDQKALPKGTLVQTGIKADMPEGQYLNLYSRSSNFNKLGLVLANSVGVIDKDYYNNPGNEGHIMFNIINYGFEDLVIKKGDRIGQGVFVDFYITKDDEAEGAREDGWGSTGN